MSARVWISDIHNGKRVMDMSTQGALNRRIKVRFPEEARNVSHFQNAKIGCGALPNFHPVGFRGSFPPIRLSGHEADISPRCSDKVQNACSCMSIAMSSFKAIIGTYLPLSYVHIHIDIK